MLNLSRIFDVAFSERLESNIKGVYFDSEFTVKWRRKRGKGFQRNRSEAVKKSVFIVASQVARESSPLQLASTQFWINAELGKMGVIEDGSARIQSAKVCLSIAPEASEQVNIIQHEEMLSSLQRGRLARLEEFRSLVFSDAGAATSYWLMNHPEHLQVKDHQSLLNLIDQIAENDSQRKWNKVAQIVTSFVSNLDEEDKERMLSLLGALMSRFGHREDAEKIALILDPVRRGEDQQGL